MLVANDAVPVNAPLKPVDVTDTSPAIVVADAPNEIDVVPTVTALFVNAPFGILVNDAPEPLNVVAANNPVDGLYVNLVDDVFAVLPPAVVIIAG